MSDRELDKLKNKNPPSLGQKAASDSTAEVSTYVVEMTRGMRQLTRGSRQKDLVFLDYLLAIVEQEATSLTSNVYH